MGKGEVDMAGCVLRVSGATFQIDAFLLGVNLAPCKVWHVGDQARPRRPASTSAGFNVTVSEASDLPSQVADAIEFLRDHHADLLRLSNMPEVDDVMLDFGIFRRDVLGQFDEFPSTLVRAAGELQISLGLSQYVSDDGG